jgi:hypothetical protein
MAKTISFDSLSTIGMLRDTDPLVLPIGEDGFAWSNVQNFRFKNGVAQKMPGYSLAFDTSSTITPYFHLRVDKGLQSNYVYCGMNKIYCYYLGVHYNITRQTDAVDVDYNATSNNQWNATILNGLAVFNNGVDAPQSWTVVDHGTKLTDLNAWPTNYKASVIRAYKAYLIALDITNDVNARDYGMVKWSSSALPGELPTTWDPTDLTADAGEQSLSDTPGYLVDSVPLGDYNIIYKNTTTYIMSYVGGNTIFSIRKLFSNIGMIAKNCCAEFNSKHFVVTTDDVIIHDGHSYQSVISDKNKKFLFNTINQAAAHRTFVVPNYTHTEMWICFPSGSATYPNQALIFNYESGTWTKRLLPETSCISAGFVDLTPNVTWDSQSAITWNDAQTVWKASKYNARAWALSMVVPIDQQIHTIDIDGVTTDNGVSTYVYLERTAMFKDQQSMKMVKRVWPNITKINGLNNNIDIFIGVDIDATGDYVWQGPYAFNIQNDTKIDCFATGRNIAIRFSSNTDIEWNISSFDLELDLKGRW